MIAVYGRWTIGLGGLTQNCDGWGEKKPSIHWVCHWVYLEAEPRKGCCSVTILCFILCFILFSFFVSCVIHDGSKRSAVKSARGRSNRSSNGLTPPPTAFTKTPSTPSNPSPCTLAPPTCVSTRPGDNRARSCGWSAACVPGRACDKSSAIIARNYYPQLSTITRNYPQL